MDMVSLYLKPHGDVIALEFLAGPIDLSLQMLLLPLNLSCKIVAAVMHLPLLVRLVKKMPTSKRGLTQTK